ncbi:MAG: PIN domain nuclease, partial [Ruminococcus sp.]|nr:PIN domain nuclease [Ruminococcus sp.]
MKILDANMVLRFLVRDNEEMAQKVVELLDTESCLFTNEVAAEVVYALGGSYKLSRADISRAMLIFLEVDGVDAVEYEVLSKGLKFFGDTSFDFVDC